MPLKQSLRLLMGYSDAPFSSFSNRSFELHIFSFIYFVRAAKIRDVDGAWSGKNKSGETISKQPGSNRPGANVPDASNSGN